MSKSIGRLVVFALAASVCAAVAAVSVPAADAGIAPPVMGDFELDPVFSGLNLPVAVAPAADGHVFVAQKGGEIFMADALGGSLGLPIYSVAGETNTDTDRGLLGLTVHPDFGSGSNYIYALYTYDPDDICDDGDGSGVPIGASPGTGCRAYGKLIRLEVNPATNSVVGSPVTMFQNKWCIEYSTHTVGDLEFGPDGYLYVSGGDGAGFDSIDYGQGTTSPKCSDPANEGGALRSQDLRTSGDPLDYNGTILRIDPITGAAAPGNPSSADSRIIAFGLRNPFRFGIDPSSGLIYSGDVGWSDQEEINRIDKAAPIENFGWPCYEGAAKQPIYDAQDLPLCESLYSAGTATSPWYQYPHDPNGVNDSDGTGGTTKCDGGTASISGVEFYAGNSNYPSAYDGAMFFSDYSTQCAWAVLAPGGVLDTANPKQILANSFIVDIARATTGDLLMVDIVAGQVQRLGSGMLSPVAKVTANTVNPALGATVTFSAKASGDPDGLYSALSFAWDLDGDGSYDDATGDTASRSFPTTGTFTVRLRVTDGDGLEGLASIKVYPGNTAPVITLKKVAPSGPWKAGQTVTVTATADDAQDGAINGASMSWRGTLEHCEFSGSCHSHFIAEKTGSSYLSAVGLSHEYPSFYRYTVTVTDAAGQSAKKSIDLQPDTVDLSVSSVPGGIDVSAGVETETTPYVLEVITGSTISVIAPASSTVDGVPFTFSSWSNGLARSHSFAVNSDTSITADYAGTASAVAGICDSPGDPFGDVPGTSFARDAVTCIYNLGVTTGTSPSAYSPFQNVTREQMASFLARLYEEVHGEAAPVVATPFTDVSSTSFAKDDIARIYGLGITTGTSSTTYSPKDNVTREQMASFLARLYAALAGSNAPVVSTPFDDVASSSFAYNDVRRIYGLDITTGTSATKYSPKNNVTREQMAAFLARLYIALLT